jgi:hypothetical protein
MTKIAGAPTLGKPFRISGAQQSIFSEGHGLSAPAFYDWDSDGLKDLLIGEFGSGIESGKYVGNFVRVYKNSGTLDKPDFTGTFDYARPPFKMPGNGTPLSVDQFCCIGFTPQFIDLNQDGNQDLITGQYYGEVTWFRGSDEGFMPGEFLPQAVSPYGPPRHEPKDKKGRKAHQYYWLYSSASFGDFTQDGKVDLITGSTTALHISKNIGSPSNPEFGQRELLLDVNGNPLKIYSFTEKELKYFDDLKFMGIVPPTAGDDHLMPYVTDWNNDGDLDLLVTNSYAHKGLAVIDFFKGTPTVNGYRFQPAVPLFAVDNGEKAFPGSDLRIAVVDWNNDGVNDLLIGTSIITTQNEFNGRLSWGWEEDVKLRGAGKDPANIINVTEDILKQYKESVELPSDMSIEEYMTIRHRGYVYIMLGSKSTEPVKTKEKKTIKQKKQDI